ncbi:hypothetical protein IQ07DRAFT_213128 [Pyrenochaeta sp. DS3sAY3a]|nr:hypothetical protein IQ07DRAFT_213128 [Pyrenochaeta sp. DS3sAY3a]
MAGAANMRERAAADAHAPARAMLCGASLMRAWGFIYLRPSCPALGSLSHPLGARAKCCRAQAQARPTVSPETCKRASCSVGPLPLLPAFAARDHSVHVSCWHLVVLVGHHQQCEPTSADAFISPSSFTALLRSLRLVHTTQQQMAICLSHAMSLCSIHLSSALRRSLTIHFRTNH